MISRGDAQGTRLLIDGLKYRLRLVIPYAKTWDQALAQGALPQNALRGWKSLLDLSSDAWHGIGDTSADVNSRHFSFFSLIFNYRLIGIQNVCYSLQFIKVQRFTCFKINRLKRLIL